MEWNDLSNEQSIVEVSFQGFVFVFDKLLIEMHLYKMPIVHSIVAVIIPIGALTLTGNIYNPQLTHLTLSGFNTVWLNVYYSQEIS